MRSARNNTSPVEKKKYHAESICLEKYPQLAVADLGAPRHAPDLYGPKFSQFHAVSRKIWQNHMSHFSYACKTEGENGISHLISKTA